MIILHYFLGLPPKRSGGLTKYAVDLMASERELGHNVYALYPGNFSFFSRICRFIKKGEFVYELSNGMPVPLMYGIANPLFYVKKRRIEGFGHFFEDIKPDVFHIHTLMGLPKEVITLMKSKEVKIVYTSHDYFGLCPNVNFVDNFNRLCAGASPEKCKMCCMDSKGLIFLKMRNSCWITSFRKILR